MDGKEMELYGVVVLFYVNNHKTSCMHYHK